MRPTLALIAAIAMAATPALAEMPSAPRQIPCALGPHGKIGQVNAERVTARLDTSDEHAIRYEYRVVLRNPNLGAAQVVPVLELPGVVAVSRPAALPPRATVEVLIGYVPVSNPVRRGAPPAPEQVMGSFTLDHCAVAVPSGPGV